VTDDPGTIRIGQTLSHYRITAAIGAGGMGEVYRATDVNLHRDVAVKMLPIQVAQDPDRLSRFRREAHLLAALNHPNIAGIYGLEEAGGTPFLVLELVEGVDLAQRLRDGALPVDEALAIALQVAEALEEAHNKGIVHRDLKPANVKLTPDGKVKVLDFGLAKAWTGAGADASSGSGDVSHSPTLAYTGTIAGVILGTAAYMSPEQARGKPVDKRADVWAFGVLMWEMLSGRRLFTGDTITDVIAAVVTKEPDLAALPNTTPPAVRRLLARCLQKDPRKRLPDMGTARLELQEVLSGVADPGPQPVGVASALPLKPQARSRERWAWLSAVLILCGVVGYLLAARVGSTPARQSAEHFLIDTPENLSFGDFPSQLAMSPDGRNLVFAATTTGGTLRLWIRPLDSLEARPLSGTDEGGDPFWSPDGTSVAFFAGNELRKLSLSSGTVQRICALPKNLSTGGTWNDEGTIVFSAGGPAGTLYRVPATGGDATPLTTLDQSRKERGYWFPQFLPGGHQILVIVGSPEAANRGVYVLSLDKPSERQRILPDPDVVKYAAGHLLSVQGGVLTARDFDVKHLAVTGTPVSLGTGVATWASNATWGFFTASEAGGLVWLSAVTTDIQLQWIDRDGKPLGTLGERAKYGQIVLSPDDKRLAAEIADADGRYDLWILDVARGVASRFTSDPDNERDPVWSPDSNEIVFSSDAGGNQHLFRKSLLGSEPPAPLPADIGKTPGKRDIAESWLRDGNTLVYMIQGPNGERTLSAASLDGKTSEVVGTDHFASDEHHVSPDGRWLTYMSQESGHADVYVEPFRRRGEKVRVSVEGGGQPRWRGDGKEIFYLSLDGGLMAASVKETATGVEIGIPTALVTPDRLNAIVEGPDYDDYAVSANGQKFLVKKAASKNDRQRLHMLLNWAPTAP
jgi:Tol biopolymer transport system component